MGTKYWTDRTAVTGKGGDPTETQGCLSYTVSQKKSRCWSRFELGIPGTPGLEGGLSTQGSWVLSGGGLSPSLSLVPCVRLCISNVTGLGGPALQSEGLWPALM